MTLLVADCLDALRTLPADSVDACVTDPPYHLTSIVDRFGSSDAAPAKGGVYNRSAKGFMGHTWDGGDLAHRVELWQGVCRVLKPGGYLVSFAATRTYHRMACAIEDAGFVPRDMIAWLYGSGFPKSHNDAGRGTALKPAHEPIALMQKPRDGTYAANYEAHGTGYLNIDDARVPLNGESKETNTGYTDEKQADGWGTRRCTTESTQQGRWPANVCHDGNPAVLGEFPQSEGSGDRKRVLNCNHISTPNELGLNRKTKYRSVLHGDGMGNAARFFYCGKPSRGEKEAGLDGFDTYEAHELNGRAADSAGSGHPRAGIQQGTLRRNTHATVKPIQLMRWLIRLVVPVGGMVLDPFLGSGTTAIAAVLEDRRWVGVERETEYARIAQARIDWWAAQHRSRGGRSVAQILGEVPATAAPTNNLDLFDGERA